MKTIIFLATVTFLLCFSGHGSAKEGELVLQKEYMYWVPSLSDTLCDELIKADAGNDLPDMRDEPCGFEDGKFSLTLSGPPGTTVTLFGSFYFGKENGYLIIRKKDDRGLWLLDLVSFPDRQWFTSEANKDSGAFETFYHAAPRFEESVSSVKWGTWWSGNQPMRKRFHISITSRAGNWIDQFPKYSGKTQNFR